MTSHLTLREVLARGVQPTYREAIAIAQELITYVPTDTRPLPPFGPRSLDNVRISRDGSVECLGCDATPGVSEIAILLEQLLPRGGPSRVPGGLRYTLARALLEVDAPPFESAAELSVALARYEHDDRADAVRALYARAAALSAEVVEVQSDRRRRAPSATELRRQLRQADEALFHQTQTVASAIQVPHLPSVQRADRPVPAHWLVAGAMAALIAFGAGYIVVDTLQGTRARTTSAAPLPSREMPPVLVPSMVMPAASVLPSRRPAPPATAAGPARGGSLVRVVSTRSGDTFSPAFGSNGTALFFHSGKSSDPHSALEAAQLDADNLRVMTILDDGARNYHVRPSPDGSQLAFDSDRDGERGVYVANRDGTNVRRVSGPGFAAVPSWSPDGGTLAFIRAEANRPRVWNLWLQDLASGRTRRLTSFRFGQTWSASWFPDGRRICFTHEDRLIVLDVQSGVTREYSSPVPRALMRTPAVSPDGKRVVFQVARSGAWLMDLDTASMVCVLTDPTAEEFAWSPDGRRIAFHSRRDGAWGIWLMTST